MSVISCVFVPEGIAMAADSRITGARIVKDKERIINEKFTISDNGQKLFLLKDRIGISFTGNTMQNNQNIVDYLSDFSEKEITEDDNVDTVIEKLHQNLKAIDPNNTTIFFVGGYVGNEQRVYRVNAKEIYTWTSGKGKYGACWNGDIAHITNLINGKPKMEFDWNHMYLRDAIEFAEFIVDVNCKAQRFANGVATCGGPIDLLLITKDGARWIRHKILKP
ncbi:MAG: hypothetical protein K6F23_03770 [Solobacterium sp.]|nr:hypothetical protein [Solobacterium sp.]